MNNQLTTTCNCCGRQVKFASAVQHNLFVPHGSYAHRSCVRQVRKAQAMMARIRS